MFTVIGIMFAGIFIGYLLRKLQFLKYTVRTISYTIFILLFLLGIAVGSNEQIMNNLPKLGGQALLIATATTAGSVLAAWGVYVWFFKGGRDA